MGKQRVGIVAMAVVVGVLGTGCGRSAEDFAGIYNGDMKHKFVFAGKTTESTTTGNVSFSAVDGEILRQDDPACPIEFKMASDTSFSMTPRSCSLKVADGTSGTVTFKTGELSFSDERSLAMLIDGVMTVQTDDGPKDMTISDSFNGKKQ